MRNRRLILAIAAVALLIITAARHPSADIRILTHDQADRAPHRVQAAIDLGLVGFSVLVTWSAQRFT